MNTEALQALARRRPEWGPWLAVIGTILDESRSPEWDAAVPAALAPGPGTPLLAAAVLRPNGAVGRLFQRLLDTATGSGAPALAGLAGARRTEALAHPAFAAALNGDEPGLDRLTVESGLEAPAFPAFRAVAQLLPIPFLRACGRAWAGRLPRGWREGYCPICGAWPALAEVCGVQRSRYLRCGRCASAWESPCLVCAYCGTRDHEHLGTLVPGEGEVRAAIETCARCSGYLKSFNSLNAGTPESVTLRDLDSVELDLVAVSRGLGRPPGLACVLGVTFAAADSRAA